VRFYELDAIAQHRVDLPTLALETMAFWLIPPEALLEEVRQAGLDVHSGLCGIGYATRMMLPAFMTCDTLDFSHSVGSANSPWQAVFIFERYQHGLGFTQKAYERLHEIMPRVLAHIRACDCADGCPVCVGKPLRQYATWNVERHEANVPSKRATVMILEGLLGDGANLNCPDTVALTEGDAQARIRLEAALRRRLERMREPQLFHPIEPEPSLQTEYPRIEPIAELDTPDVAQRRARRTETGKALRRALAKHEPDHRLDPHAARHGPPEGMAGVQVKPPGWFRGRPEEEHTEAAEPHVPSERPQTPPEPIRHGDSLAARARKLKKQRGRE
jgi:hypothetical protein